jgi:hypothetical protein
VGWYCVVRSGRAKERLARRRDIVAQDAHSAAQASMPVPSPWFVRVPHGTERVNGCMYECIACRSQNNAEKSMSAPHALFGPSTPTTPSAPTAADTSPTPCFDAGCLRGASSDLSKLHRHQPRLWCHCTLRALCAEAPLVCAAIDRYVGGMA